MKILRITLCFACGLGIQSHAEAGSSSAAGQAPPNVQQEPKLQWVYYDFVDEQGRLRGGRLQLVMRPRPLHTLPARVSSFVVRTGPPANRIDLVTVGDGYTAGELGAYADHVDATLGTMFNQEPFTTYENFFNIHVVDVISNESGVDHDPTYPIWRDTAMNMGFWCEGIERLLCVDVVLAYAYASNAPDVDMVLAVANSSKYGGAGYSAVDLATVAGGNGFASEIALHEFGHSLGDLADEYDYGDGTIYSGPEPGEPNVSILAHADMAASGTKWSLWLEENYPAYNGYISTYEGAYYHEYGIYRPTVNSKMRSLSHPFNLPCVESLVIQMYHVVHPIDDSTPTTQVLTGSEVVYVDPVDPVGHTLDIAWHLDGSPIPGANGATLDLRTAGLTPGPHVLAVTVTDNTWFVRDDDARSEWLSETRTWAVQVAEAVPAISAWGMVTLTLAFLVAGTLLLRRPRQPATFA